MKKVFVSYAHEDADWKNRLLTHLEVMGWEGFYGAWHDRKIPVGSKWEKEINKELKEADAAILLISADFLNSEFIRDIEVPVLLERCENDGLLLYPVIVRDCVWNHVDWLKELQVFLPDGIPLKEHDEKFLDKHFKQIAEDVKNLLQAEKEKKVSGGPRKISLSKLPTTENLLIGRKKELEMLNEAWDDLNEAKEIAEIGEMKLFCNAKLAVSNLK